MRRRRWRVAIAAGLCLGLALPVSSPSTQAQTVAGDPQPASASLAGQPQDYVIGPLDKLSVKVFKVPELSSEAIVVGADGQIGLPLIGSVQAAGKTSAALAKDIADRLAANYLQSPQVSVYVEDSASRKVTVEGDVKSSGVFEMKGQITLLQAIAMAGGMGDTANVHKVALIRSVDGARSVTMYDYQSIRTARAPDPDIKGDDVVIVDTSGSRKTFSQVLQAAPLLSMLAIMR